MNKENILEIDNLERSYSTVMPDGETKVYSVLRGISFQVKRGEFIGIMGSSGCGKTTLLKTIGMLNKPNGGKVLYNGEDLWRSSGRNTPDATGVCFSGFLLDE